jgi:hypothetical protein
MSPAIRRYQPDARPPLATADQFVVVIPAGISKTSDLLAMLAAQLHFPAWFGCNWNALSDCLRDLSWIEESSIVIFHEDRPAIPAADLEAYLDVLTEAIASWQPGETHVLEVWMPEKGTKAQRHKGTKGKVNSRV